MTQTNFQDWAVVAHKDDTGFGRHAADCRAVLGIGHQFVIPSERLQDHPIDERSEYWLPKNAPDKLVRSLLSRVKGILFFERPDWHPHLLPIAHELGVTIVCVPNWEWFRPKDPRWKYCDLFICPSNFTESILNRFGYQNTVVLPWTLDLDKLPVRHISGQARTFIHNAGLIDKDDRKGTRDAIKAFSRVPHPDIRLIVRLQKPVDLPNSDSRIQYQIGNIPSIADLYQTGDVCIQPSKMEGIGFMVLEPVTCGIPVITTDHAPMNEYVQHPELRCRLQWFRRKAFATRWAHHAYLRLPSIRDLSRRIAWCAEHDMASYSRCNLQWGRRTFSKTHLAAIWRQAISLKSLSKLSPNEPTHSHHAQR